MTRAAACDLEEATSDTIAYLAALMTAFETARANAADTPPE
ncbi:hypothetical protein [Roseovarius salis]